MLLTDIHGPIVLGILGGLFGSFFINVNTRMSMLRKKYSTTTARRTFETGMFAFMTISVCVLFISFGDMGGCQAAEDPDSSDINVHNL